MKKTINKYKQLALGLVLGFLLSTGYQNYSGQLTGKIKLDPKLDAYCEDLQTKDLFYLESKLMVLEGEDRVSEVDMKKFEYCETFLPAEYI